MNKIIFELRDKIDQLDSSIAHDLGSRLAIARKIIAEKAALGLNLKDNNRESEIISRLSDISGLDEEFWKELYSVVFKKALEVSAPKANNLHEILFENKFLIAGPCTVESYEQTENIASEVARIGIKLLRGGAFKPRTSPKTFQGLGDEGIDILRSVADKHKMYIVTEIMDNESLNKHYDKVDVIQIGSRSMANYSLLKAVGQKTAGDGKPILLKRYFAATISELLYAAEYITQFGNNNVVLCLRGIRTFEQVDSHLRFTPDLGSIAELKERTNLKIAFDPSHASGKRMFVTPLALAAISLGADGIMAETHTEKFISGVDTNQHAFPSDLKVIFNALAK